MSRISYSAMVQGTYIDIYLNGACYDQWKGSNIKWDPHPIAIGDHKGSGTSQQKFAIAIEMPELTELCITVNC